MDIVSVVLEFVSCIATPISGYLDYYRKIRQDVEELRRKVIALNTRKEDIQRMVQIKICSKKVISKQVEDWLIDVQRIDDEMQDIEEKVSRVSYFSRAQLGKLVRRKVEEVKEIHQRNFPEGLVIDVPPTIETTLSTDSLKTEVAMKEKIRECLTGNEDGMIEALGIGGVGKKTRSKTVFFNCICICGEK
ncbi:hypothetical protein SLE2022_375650 [Rubroshorea leprosula]